MLLVTAASRKLGAPRGPAVSAGLAAGGFYTLAAGAGPPLVRAYAMTVAAAAGWLLDRDSGAFQGLLLAAWFLLLLRPSMLFQAGFQMSCAATLAILLAVSHWRTPRSWPAAARWLAEALLVSAAAQLAMAPLLAAYFHRVSIVGIVSNAALVPFAMGLIGAGFALFAASLLPTAAPAAALALAVGFLVRTFRVAVRSFAGLPGAAFWIPAPPPFVHLSFAFLALSALGATDAPRSKRLAALGFACLIPAALAAWRPAPLEIAVSARGAASLIRSPDGHLLLLNAGARGEDLAHTVLSDGRHSVDEVRLTGLDRGRWKGLGRLAEIIRVPEVVAPPGKESPALADLRARLQRDGTLWRIQPPRDDAFWGVAVRETRRGAGLAVELSWHSLSAVIDGRGAVFDGDFEQFDIVGPFERRPKGAVVLRYDGLVARMERPS
jgi:ComEC/Rec2-related protein